MPYPIKDSPPSLGVSEPNTLWGKLYGYIGVNQGGYGLTSTTGYWNGKTPNVGGYVVYVGNGLYTSPTMYVCQNDAQLIDVANLLVGVPGTFTTVNDAIIYLSFNDVFRTIVNIDAPNIVTNGLQLCLDAGYVYSYPRTGDLWADMSSMYNNGSLTNGPTYASGSGGSIVFDGVNDYVIAGILNYTNSDFSFSYWIYVTSLTTNIVGNGPVIIYQGSYQVNGYYDQLNADGSISFITNVAGGGAVTNTASGVISAGQVYNISYTRNGVSVKIYVNGVNVTNSAGIHANPVSSSSSFIIGSYGGTYLFSNVEIFSLSSYNRRLSAAEVLQNYYAGLQRFIPTDNLVLWLDGTNTNTRVITPTTAYDMSGNNYDGTFTNGAVLTHRDGGTVFYFDGIDDTIQTTLNTLASSTTWTIWVKRTSSVNFYNMMMGMYLPYFAFRSDGSIHFSNNIGGVQQSLTPYPPGLVNNVWYHMSFVSSYSAGNTTMSIYLNGVIISQATFAGQQPTTTNNSFRLGGWEDGGSYQFNGKIGDVRIYNRALTSTEISTIYTAGKSRYGL